MPQVQRQVAITFCFLSSCVLTFSRKGIADDFDLAKDWEPFCTTVENATGQQLLEIRDALTARGQKNSQIQFLIAHAVLAERFGELGRNDDVVRTLERALDTPVEGKTVTDVYGIEWISILRSLCDAVAVNGNPEDISARISHYGTKVSADCYCQKIGHADLVLDWERRLHGDAHNAAQAKDRLLEYDASFPSNPTIFEIRALLNIAKNAAFSRVSSDEKLRVILRCRDAARSSIRNHKKDAELSFLTVSASSFLAAKLYLENDVLIGRVDSLIESLEQARRDFQENSEPGEYEEQYGHDIVSEFRNFVERKLKAMDQPTEPSIHESPLLGKQAPRLNTGIIVLQGVLPKKGPGRRSVVLIDFWETWCGPCIAGFQKLEALNNQLGPEGLEIVGITSLAAGVWDIPTSSISRDLSATRDAKLDATRNFIEHHSLNYVQLLDENDELKNAFGVTSFPTYVLIDRNGTIRLVAGGGSQTLELIERMAKDMLKATEAGP